MSEKQQLDAAQKHILKLIHRDSKPDGWTPVSALLYKTISENIPLELAAFEPTEDGRGRSKLTEKGREVVEAMDWL